MSTQEITIKWSIDEIGQYCSNVSAYVASTMAQDGNTFDIFTMTKDDNVTFLEGNVREAILALTPFFNRITPDTYEPIDANNEVGLSFIPRIEGGDYSHTELSYVQSLCKRYIANYILNAWYVSHNANTMVSYFTNANVLVGKNITDALVRFVRPVRKASSSIRKVTYGGVAEKHLYHINNRSDFAILWRPKDNLPMPEFDYNLVFFTDDKNAYAVNSEDAQLFKKITDTDGKVSGARVIFDFDQEGVEFFNNGVLKYKMFGQVPDADFPDGSRSFEAEYTTDIEIWDGPSDTEADMSVSYIPSYVKLTFQDLTEQDIQVLQEPALEAKAEWDGVKPAIEQAIIDANNVIGDVETAVYAANGGALNANAAATQARSQGSTAEQKGRNAQEAADRANNIATTIEGNYNAKIAEIDAAIVEAEQRISKAISDTNYTIVDAENALSQVEERLVGVDNTLANVQAKINDSVAATNNANTAAQSANDAAIAANKVANDSNQAENARVVAEESREEAEGGRVDAENARVSAEKQRENLESDRKANETARQNAENAREAAEAKRQTDTAKAISDVKSETATALSNMQSKVDTAVGNANQATASATQAAQEANEAREGIEEALGAKADKDGNYPELTAGFAENIVGDGSSSSEVLSFRPTAGENRNTLNEGAARIAKLKGNSVGWNQLVNHSTIYSATSNGIEFTVSNGKVIANGTATANAALGIRWNSTQGHIYAMVGCPSGGSESTYKFYNQATVADYGNGVIYTESRSGAIYNVIQIKSGVTANNLTFTPRIYDLTKMFGAGNEPTTVEQFYSMLPVGVDLNAYNAGEIMDSRYGAIKTTALNQWDEQWRAGYYSNKGIFYAAAQNFANANPIPIVGGATYCFNKKATTSSGVFQVLFYDNAMQLIGGYNAVSQNKGTIEAPTTARFCNFFIAGIETYNNDICVNISWPEYTSLNGTYQPYKPFVRDLSWVVNKYFNGKMRSAGSARDEIRFNSTTQKWEAVQNVGVVDLGSLDWFIQNNAAFVASVPNKKIGSLQTTSEFANNTKESFYFSSVSNYNKDTLYCNSGNVNIYVVSSTHTDAAAFKAAMAGVMLNYELATPIVTEIEENVNFDFDCSDYGTEELLVAEGAQSAPLAADIVYAPNALSTIKNVPDIFTRLAALEAALASLTSATTTNVEE